MGKFLFLLFCASCLMDGLLGQTIGGVCTVDADCTTLLNEECTAGTCSCVAGYEVLGGSTQCTAKDCGALADPANGNIVFSPPGSTIFNTAAVYFCNTGYDVTGSNSRTCTADGTWSGTSPTCELKDCGALTVPANGNIDNTLTTYQEIVVFTCNTGYSIDGTASLTCEAAGTWSANAPTCVIVDCGTLNAPTNGGLDISGGTTYLSTVTFSCSAGYELVGTATRTCEASGLWSGADPVCTIRDCGALTAVTDGALTYDSGVTTFGAGATYTCANGYDLIGTATFLCQSDGTWSNSGVAPTCSIKDCGAVTTPTDGSVTLSSGTTYGSKATFSCDTGYTLTGSASINCGTTGNWDGTEPTCVIKDCGSLTAPANGGQTFSSGTTYNSVATFTCVTGYILTGDTTSTCEATSAWSSNPPTCVIQNCGQLTAPANGGVGYSAGTTYSSLAVFTCALGYTLNGNSPLTCQANGGWSDSEPFCNINDCGPVTAPTNGAIDSQTGTDYQSTVTFSCNTGYDLVGSTSITCQSEGSWSNAVPICNVKDCGAVTAPTDGSISSNTGTIYLSQITFACNAGYSMQGSSLILCQPEGTWSGNTPTCTIKDCGTLATPTDGALSLSSGTTYGSEATFTCDQGYSLIGSASLDCEAGGAWSGSVPTCTIKDCGALSSPINGGQTGTTTTYGSTITFSCNTGYTMSGAGSTACQDDATWSNAVPTCVINDCGALTAPTDGVMSNPTGLTTFGTTVTFTCNTGYTLVGSASIDCQSDSTWSDNVPVCDIKDCGALNAPSDGNVLTPSGTTYGATATFTCNMGYTIVGASSRNCQSTGAWSASDPTCQINDCGVLPQPTNGGLTLPGGTTYNSVGFYTCDLGYTLVGDTTRTCQSDATWSSAAPVCQIKDCGTLTSPTDGLVDLSGGTTYTSVATFTCNTGYTLTGVASRTCQDNSDWSDTSPTCVIKDCGTLAAPTNGGVDLSGGTEYLSQASFSCDAGYTLTGSQLRTCQDDGTWETPSPTCVIKDCGNLTNPVDGSVDTSSGTVYQSNAAYSCDPGYDIVGASSRQCGSDGTWGGTAPTCTRKDCGTLVAPANGAIDLTQGTLFEATATFSCDIGYTLNGETSRDCLNTGSWANASPVCDINDCGALTAPTNGSVDTSSGTTYEEVATYNCDPGFTLTGTETRVCQADSTWNDTEPTCVIKDCGSLTAPTDGSVVLSPNSEYQGVAQFSCDTGYTLNGSSTRTCLATGVWSTANPVCDINDCGTIADPSNGLVDLTAGTTYQSIATFTCNIGYTLDGVTQRQCQANSTWADESPVCNINDCGPLTDPANGTVDTSGGTVYQSVATFSCDTGFNLIGIAAKNCLAPGTWETPLPYCEIKDCGTLNNPDFGTVNISGATTYLSQVSYTCDAGFDLSGPVVRTCASDGNWTDSDPQCLRRDCGSLPDPDFGFANLTGGTLFEDVMEYGCNLGFNLTDGSTYRYCLSDGTWNGTEPSCVTKDCGALNNPDNGQVSTPGGTTFLQTAYYTCNTGYDLNGVSTRQCSDSGGHAVWSDLEPTCVIKDCGVLAAPNNGFVDTSSGTTYLSTALYSCTTGYEVNGLASIVCASDGSWSQSPPTCELKNCGTATSIANGNAATTGGTLYGATATYSCNTGYGLVGTATISCLDTGLWDTPPSCSPDCGVPPTVDQATVVYASGTLSGATATYTCNNGYSLSGGATITCSTTGTWSNEPFCAIQLRQFNETCFMTSQCVTVASTCRDNGQGADQCICALQGEIYDSSIDTCLADCGVLPDPTNGLVALPSVTAAGQIATYTCNVGYALSGSIVRTCGSTGSWSGSAPICITGCGSLDPPTNGYVNTTDGMVSGKIAYYTCNSGYTMVGSEERVCLEDSTWSGNAPICAINCPVLGDIDHGTVDLALGNWEGSLSTYICDKDYALVGTPTRTCQGTGIWTGVPPECVFAIFPEILLVFGSLFIFLFIVDIAVLSFCLYIRYCKPKKPGNPENDMSDVEKKEEEEEEYPNIFEEKPPVSIPPLISSSFRGSNRKPRNPRISPESTQNHPPPRKPKIDRPLYKYSVKPKTEIPEPDTDRKPNSHIDPLTTPRYTKPSHELQIEDFNDGMHSDDSRRHNSAPEDDQISLFDTPTQHWEPANETAKLGRAPTLADEVHETADIRARMSLPPVPDPPVPIQNESEKFYSEERRRYLKNTVNAYARK